ncbi:MAG: hypothetical protein WD069_14890 [Planctomycetales bacterium]
MPTLARFTARDPMPPGGLDVLPGSAALYRYARNSPVGRVDPSGMQCMSSDSKVFIDPVRNPGDPPTARFPMSTVDAKIEVLANHCDPDITPHYSVSVEIDSAVLVAGQAFTCAPTTRAGLTHRIILAMRARLGEGAGLRPTQFIGEEIACQQPTLEFKASQRGNVFPGLGPCAAMKIEFKCNIPCRLHGSSQLCERPDGQAVVSFRGQDLRPGGADRPLIDYTGPGQQIRIRWSVNTRGTSACCSFESCTPTIQLEQFPSGFPVNPPGPPVPPPLPQGAAGASS